MALLINKIFSSKKNVYNKQQDAHERAFPFTQEQVRLLLFRECDFRGRKLLFDSETVQRVSVPKSHTAPNKHDAFVEVSNGFGYQYSRPSGDTVQLGEMVFGSVAMSFRGTSLKIHSFDSPAKLMCTQVFPSPRQAARGRRSVTSQLCADSISGHSLSASSGLSVQSSESVEGDSGYGSFGWLRSASTSLDSALADEPAARARSKLGLALLLHLSQSHELRLQRFLLEHAALLESVVWRCRAAAELAYTRPATFASVMHDTWAEAAAWLQHILTGPPLPLPTYLWHAHTGSDKLVRELCDLLQMIDVKHTNFFMSTLLTAVLTQHVGWVATVWPIDNTHAQSNPLWRQLSELYGSVGDGARQAHTIVCGSRADLIARILSVLTYFIRCSMVQRQTIAPYDFSTDAQKETKSTLSYKNYSHTLSKTFRERNQRAEELEMSALNLKLPVSDGNLKSLNNNKENGGISRTKSCLGLNVVKQHPLLDKVTSLGLSAAHQDNNNMKLFDDFKKEEVQNLIDIKEASDQVRKIFVPKSPKFRKEKSFSNLSALTTIDSEQQTNMTVTKSNEVVFVLGDGDELVGLKSDSAKATRDNINRDINIPSCSQRPTNLNIPLVTKTLFTCDSSDSSPEVGKVVIARGKFINVETENGIGKNEGKTETRRDFSRSQSVPPSDKSQRVKVKCSRHGCKNKHSGVRFDLKQYPQIVTNYMKSKHLEMSLKLNRSFSASLYDCSELPSCECEPREALQTPSNASELESSSELAISKPLQLETNSELAIYIPSELKSNSESAFFRSELESSTKRAGSRFSELESSTERAGSRFSELESSSELAFSRSSELESSSESSSSRRSKSMKHPLERVSKENNAIFEHDMDMCMEQKMASNNNSDNLVMTELPMPEVLCCGNSVSAGYTNTLMRGVSEHYVSDLVLQGVCDNGGDKRLAWQTQLRRDLGLSARRPHLQEAAAVIADTDTWQVHLVSSCQVTGSVRVAMSQLVANMLESLLHLHRLRTPAEYCLQHLECRLREVCSRSVSLAGLLLATDWCSLEQLTGALQVAAGDVPLLWGAATTHSPQLATKYGLSFQ